MCAARAALQGTSLHWSAQQALAASLGATISRHGQFFAAVFHSPSTPNACLRILHKGHKGTNTHKSAVPRQNTVYTKCHFFRRGDWKFEKSFILYLAYFSYLALEKHIIRCALVYILKCYCVFCQKHHHIQFMGQKLF